jgi:endo-1,4-beta-xylanase
MLDPKAERFINEYGIISSGGIDKIKQDWYYNYIKEIDQNTHNSIDGIGMQSHIGSDLTSPEIILSILDRFATLDKKISISEFTMDIPDPDIRRNYTRDFMLAAFSHPAVSEFLFWGYFEPKHPKAGLIDENFEWTEMGKAFDSLVNKEWKTSLNLTTDEKGTLYGNGFLWNLFL